MSLHSHPPNQNNFNPQSSQPHHLTFPALHLHPHNDTFIPKQIALNPNGAKVKIGRQTNQKTVPNSTNGFFDSKVLSRAHAEVWTEDGKVLIRDVKSSNGTFINGERLSAEGIESEAFELHTDDVVEFGIDIIADDNKSVVHHKVSTKVFLVLNPDDALAASNFYRATGTDGGVNRRANRPGVFTGGSFDHVLNRLQSELEKSRATGQELSTLNSAMNEIHDTLGGGAGPPPPLPPPYGGRIPPLNHQQPHLQATNALQAQLAETQASLTTHVEKMKTLEGLMGEHEQLKREVGELRDQLESTRQDKHATLKTSTVDQEQEHMRGRVSPVAAMLELQERQQNEMGRGNDDDDDDDDGRSLASNDTVTWLTSSLQKTHLRPNGISSPAQNSSPIDASQLESLTEQNQKLSEKLEAISTHVEDTIKMGQNLVEQQRQSTETIDQLRHEIQYLKQEQEMQKQHYESMQSSEEDIIQKVETKWTSWKEQIEQGWRLQKESWEAERQKLLKVIQDWQERAVGEVEGDQSEHDGNENNPQASGSNSSRPLSSFSSPSKNKQKKNNKNVQETLNNREIPTIVNQSNVLSPSRSPKKVRRRIGTHNQLDDDGPPGQLDPINRLLIDEHSDASDATMTHSKSSNIPQPSTSDRIDRRPANGRSNNTDREGGVGRSLIDVR
ncbi:hypothetical protein DFH28DRAFT_461314 [Melampsora americana]|nr:hypothetical protein DFH28DRAFT_461314 [Melampsora americana]